MPARTFQELQRERERSAFVGRADELLSYKANLELAPDDPRRKFIIALSGQGGMGKTTLMSQYREAAAAAGSCTGWTNEEDEDVVAAIYRFAKTLNAPAFSEVSEAVDHYRSLRHGLEALPDAPEGLARVIASSAGRAGTKLARRIPVAGAVFDFVDEEAVGNSLGDVATFVLQRSKNKEDARLVLDPIDTLSPVFVEALNKTSRENPVALFFDTFEETGHILEPWLLRLLDGSFGDLPLEFQIVLAGRYAPDPNLWAPYEGLMERVELEPFSEKEAREFLARHRVTDPDEVTELVRLSLGLPILLVSMTIGNPEDPRASTTAVERVLRSVPETLRKVAIAGAFPRLLNRDIAKLVLSDVDPDNAFDWLVETPFVQSTSDGWKYHDVIRKEFLRYAHRESPEQWEELHRRLSDYYVKTLEKEAPDGQISQESFKTLREQFYHGICSGDAAALHAANDLCVGTWNLAPPAVRLWAVGIKDAEEDSGNPLPHWGALWIKAAAELEKGECRTALELLTKLLQNGFLSDGTQVLALIIRADMYYDISRMDKALEDLNQAFELDSEYPRVLYERAWCLLKLGEYERAFEDAEAAIELHGAEEANYGNLISLYIQAASTLFDLEDVLDLMDAIAETEETASVLIARGELHRDLHDVDKAIQDFERAMEVSPRREHRGWEEIGDAYRENGQEAEAADAYRKALAVKWDCSACWAALAFCLKKTLTKEQTKDVLTEVGSDIDSEVIRGYRGIALLNADLPDLASAELELAVKADPVQPELRLWLGRALLSSGREGTALSEVQEALKLRPEWPPAMVALGRCYASLGDHKGAVREWGAAEKISPLDLGAVSLCDRGLSLSIIGEYEQAIEVLDQALKEEPSPQVRYNRAVALARWRGVEKAQDELDRALKAVAEAESEVIRRYGAGGVRALRGETVEALEELKAACSVSGSIAQRWAASDPAWEELRESQGLEELLR